MRALVTLAELRAARKMSQEELGKHLGMTQAAISSYETGARTPPLATARRIAAFFGVPLDEIEFVSNPEFRLQKRAAQPGGRDTTAREEAAL